MSDDKKIMKTLNGYTVYDEDAHRRIDSLEGAAPGLVFDTVADMEAYVAEHSAELKVGQNLYIREVDVPDYWWDGTAVQELETKVDLSGYAKQEEVDQLSKAKADKAGWSPDKYIGTDAEGNLVEKDAPSGGAGGTATYYVATDYGISTDAEDNTPALQTLVDSVHDSGGGIIYFPVGTYNFRKTANTKYAILMQSNVSIVGENIENTIFNQSEATAYSMFYRMGTATDALHGCVFENFTVNAYDTSGWAVHAKALFFQYVKDCVFRDLRLLGTMATAMGIDYLDRVTIDGIRCVDCGRLYAPNIPGSSGIGIGTGGWDNENFVLTNCICVGSGQFGIFIENQKVLSMGGMVEYSKGCIIANCVVRNGINNGIGIRGGENVTLIGCESYENANNGIYVDSKCRNVHIMSCSSTANGNHGIHLFPNAESKRIVVKNCTAVENAGNGINVYSASDKLCIANNYTDGNTVGIRAVDLVLSDCVLHGNTLLDGAFITSEFTGNIDFVDNDPPKTITATSMTVAVNENKEIEYSVTPGTASRQMTFESTDEDVAIVDTDGVVTGVAEGDCQIIITSALDENVSTSVDVTVSGTETVLYPFVNGSKTLSDGGITITKGYHAVLVNNSGANAAYFNLSNYNRMTDSLLNPANVTGTDVLFSLKAGDVIVFELKNVVADSNKVGINGFMKTTSGATYCKINDFSGDAGGGKKEMTVTEDVDITSVCSVLTAVKNVEMDVSLTVNGVRYV